MTRNKKIAVAGGIILLAGISIGLYQYLSPAPEKKLEIEIPVFADNEPETVINSILKAINDSSLDVKFLDPVKSSQWWISDDGWNIIDPNAVSITLSGYTFKGEHPSPINPLNLLAKELNYLISKILLDNSFALNAANTSESEENNDFYDYVVAFQKGGTRCTLTTDGDFGKYSVACSNRFQEAYEEQTPYLKVLDNREVIVSVKERIGDFVWLSVHLRRTGYLALMKDRGGEIKLIFTGQEEPPCDLMIENKVPKEVYGACYDDFGNIVE
ncbi:MAG: hypothetical protein ABIG08_00290 [bacterium]